MCRPRNGVVLATAIYFIVLLGVLVIAALFSTARLTRLVGLRLADVSLAAAADDALMLQLADWVSLRMADLPFAGADSSLRSVAEPLPVQASVRTTRLSDRLFWLVSNATIEGSTAPRRRVSLVVRLPAPPGPVGAALATSGDVILGAGVRVDAVQPDAGCVAQAIDAPAVLAIAPGRHVFIDSTNGAPNTMRVVTSAALSDSAALVTFGPDTWNDLAARADVRLAPGAVTAPPVAPLIYAAGDLTLLGGTGGGVLLVEGTLTFAGPAFFTGTIISRRGIVTTGDSATVVGLMVSTGHDVAPVVILNHVIEMRASRCAAQRALARVTRPLPTRGRPWAELY